MRTNQKTTLMIEFNLANNKTTTVSIPDPREDVTKADVTAAADEIVEKKAVIAFGSPVASFKRAFIRTIQETEVE